VITMTLQQMKTILGYILIGSVAFLIATHYYWPATDFSIPILIWIVILFAIYFYIDRVKETTLCFIVRGEKVLMMIRNKKENDVHKGKYNGLGGTIERAESKERGMLREVKEEANIVLTDYEYVGKVHFKNFGYQKGHEIMYCFIGFDYDGTIGECDEGELVWVSRKDVMTKPLWEGDQYFIMNIINNQKFKGYLHYEGDKVIDHHFVLTD
jgi:8-oxo-dGTP diphosphatase